MEAEWLLFAGGEIGCDLAKFGDGGAKSAPRGPSDRTNCALYIQGLIWTQFVKSRQLIENPLVWIKD